MKRAWIKAYIEILDDPKMGRLPDWLWRRAIELFLLAGENGNDGLLQPVEDMAWRLRTSIEKLTESLQALSQVGVVHETPRGWTVTNFEKRQAAMTNYERVAAYRERQKDETKRYQDDNEVEVIISPSPSPSVSKEGGGMGEGEPTIPQSVKEALKHPDLILFEEVSGVFPGDLHYESIIRAMGKLKAKHNGTLKDYLIPFWTAWTKGKTRDGKPYKKTNPAWLVEWAVAGEIPGESALTNGAAYKPFVPGPEVKKSSSVPPKPASLQGLTKKMSNKKVLQ